MEPTPEFTSALQKFIARREKAARIAGRREGVLRCIALIGQAAGAVALAGLAGAAASGQVALQAAAESLGGLLDEKELAKGLEEQA